MDYTKCVVIILFLITTKTVKSIFFDNLKVILGGGRRYFMNSSTFDPVIETAQGRRNDGLDLIQVLDLIVFMNLLNKTKSIERAHS